MSFLETLERARAFLERNGRVSLRALQREFDLDDASLEDVVEELTEVLSFRKLDLHHRVVVLLNTAGFFDPLLAQIERAVEEGFETPAALGYFCVTGDPSGAIDLCEASVLRRV